MNKAYKIAIVTSCPEIWGGSEDLWYKSIPYLQQNGFSIRVAKRKINREQKQFKQLANNGVILTELEWDHNWKISNLVKRVFYKLKQQIKNNSISNYYSLHPFTQQVINQKPDFVVVSQGNNFDGLHIAYICAIYRIPYVIISQKAVEFYWPPIQDRPLFLIALKNSLHCFFVAQHNLTITEEQFGIRFKNASVVYNPIKLPLSVISYPENNGFYKLACIGRLFVMDKGQDILLRILKKEKWAKRPIHISFIGSGDDDVSLKAMATLLNLKNVDFIGYVDDIEKLWKEYHALIMPSRSEGLPLALIEAMTAGRPVIVTNAGDNNIVVEDGKTGFIDEPNETAFESAMERAWNKRSEWELIGQNAAQYVKNKIPICPEKDFANKLIEIHKSYFSSKANQ